MAGYFGHGYGGYGGGFNGFGGLGGYGGFGNFGNFGGFGGFGFLNRLRPGIPVVIQIDALPPAFAVFQGFQNGFVLLSNFNGFPGLVRVPINQINAVSPWGAGIGGFGY